MTPRDPLSKIRVCDHCLTAACWHGEFLCGKSPVAGTTTRTVAELNALGLEHPDNYSEAKLRDVYGAPPSRAP